MRERRGNKHAPFLVSPQRHLPRPSQRSSWNFSPSPVVSSRSSLLDGGCRAHSRNLDGASKTTTYTPHDLCPSRGDRGHDRSHETTACHSRHESDGGGVVSWVRVHPVHRGRGRGVLGPALDGLCQTPCVFDRSLMSRRPNPFLSVDPEERKGEQTPLGALLEANMINTLCRLINLAKAARRPSSSSRALYSGRLSIKGTTFMNV
jgi:hypothetical protein